MVRVADEPILTNHELETARGVLQSLPRSLVLRVKQTSRPFSRIFRTVIEQLVGVTDKLQPLYEFDAEAGDPFLEIKGNLRYFSLPTGLELAPFLQTLRILSEGGSRLSLRTLKRLDSFLIPTRLEIFISPACPHCPALVALCSDLALASSYLEVSIVDVTLFPEQAGERGIRAVPTLVINSQEQLVGALGEEVLVDRFVNRELAAFHSETFRRILKEGDARKLVATMLAEGEIPGSAVALLSDHDWSVRLGMMVVLEEIGAHRPELARRACPYLVTLLGHQDPNRRGDAAFLLGLIGDAKVLEGLEPLAEDGSPEVAEAAREAIKRIRGES
ncbi:MAG: putative electron carrier protein related to glutaredoxin [Deltaproteobacteria bacterium]|nr:putative electron carrier protein related to glutaredoxin [Deltaproteobacteria bacterium]